MPIDEIKKVLYVGVGTMGCYNSMVSALSGYEVVLYDTSQEALDTAIQRQQAWIPQLVELNKTDEETIEAAIKTITKTTDFAEAAAGVDLEYELLKHEAVAEAAVIGVPSEQWGETPLALVVPEKDTGETPESILDWVNARLGKGQRISQAEFRSELPKSSIGKILKKELRLPYWEKTG